MQLRDAQLIVHDFEIANEFKNGEIIFSNKNITIKNNTNGELLLRILPFSSAGKEIAQLVNVDINQQYINNLIKNVEKVGFTVLKHS